VTVRDFFLSFFLTFFFLLFSPLARDISQWQPLISDRCFLPWLVKVGFRHKQMHTRKKKQEGKKREKKQGSADDVGGDDVDRRAVCFFRMGLLSLCGSGPGPQ
jgi:hypothetical protein